MAFVKHKGKTKFVYYKGDTGQETRDGGVVCISDSGTVVRPENDSTDRVIGVARSNDTVTDSGMVPVEVPVELAVEWLIDVDSDAGAADSDVGAMCTFDTLGGSSVNAGDSQGMRVAIADTAPPRVFITGVVSANQITGTLVNTAWTFTNDTFDSE